MPEQTDEVMAQINHVDLAVDEMRRYPGEQERFFLSASCAEPCTLAVALPTGIFFDKVDDAGLFEPFVTTSDGETEVYWRLPAEINIKQTLICAVSENCQPGRYEIDIVLLSMEGQPLETATVGIEVSEYARYLRYMPEMYERDRLLSRFLMLFESFWQPLDRQVNNISEYFEVDLTTDRMVDFIGSWVGMIPESALPDDRKRALVKHAVELYRKRGTRPGLKRFLELVTGGQVRIEEHRSADLVLGPGAFMGHETALGRGNVPHSFTVYARIPAELQDILDWENVLADLLEREKPAHTQYSLVLEEA